MKGPATRPPQPAALRLSEQAAERIRAEVNRAGGREVCFLASVTAERVVVEPRAVARGNHQAVLAAARDAQAGQLMIHNHPSGVLEPSSADLAVAGRIYEMGLGTALTDNQAGGLYVVVEPPRPVVRTPLDAGALASLLHPGGALESAHARYEDRPEQREVLQAIASRYNDGGVAVVEAGTGTGKSLAYLLPAAQWASQNQERTVVSTNTINLQEQLVSKDLPLVSRLLDEPVRWALVKGRGNYVSIRRLRLASASLASLFEEDRSDELDRLEEWVTTTQDGSLSDLSFAPAAELWEEVQSDSDACLRARCPHFQECFYHRSRRAAASAEVLVVNHHLLFSDIAVRKSTGDFTTAAVLPAYRHLILDEAHNVEDAATSHLGGQVTRRGLMRLISRLDRRGKGVLRALSDELGGSEAADPIRDLIQTRALPAVNRTRASALTFLEAFEALLPEGALEPTRLGAEGLGEPAEDDRVRAALDALLPDLSSLQRALGRVRGRVEERPEIQEWVEGRLLDVRSAERRLESVGAALRLILDPEGSGADVVRWVTRTGRPPRRNLVLAWAPIELGGTLRSALFEPLHSVSLLSATLSTRGTFDFVRGRVGLGPRPGGGSSGAARPAMHDVHAADTEVQDPDGRGDPAGDAGRDLESRDLEPLDVHERRIASPFDYATQSLLCVPTDLPGPHQAGPFQEATARAVWSLAERTGGGVMVLFTSYRSLARVAQILRAKGAEARWPLFVQGEERRTRLLRAFEASGSAILLGTSSFWEGVDVPGQPLRGLILEKLPFRVPTEPITAARVEAIEARGGNAFWSYMLPLAALRLKQGFGRLIRARTDRGAVLLLDDRILHRRYGRYLRESLPPVPLMRGPWEEVEARLAAFYGALSGSAASLD